MPPHVRLETEAEFHIDAKSSLRGEYPADSIEIRTPNAELYPGVCVFFAYGQHTVLELVGVHLQKTLINFSSTIRIPDTGLAN